MPAPTGASQLVITPTFTSVNGQQNRHKMQAVQVSAGQLATIAWTMLSPNGDAVDFSDITGATAQLKLRDSVFVDSTINPGVAITGTIADAATGRVDFTLSADSVAYPGISRAEVGIFDSGGALVFTNTFYLVVNRSQFTSSVLEQGPLSLAEIRLHLRDSGPEDNLWLGVEEFDMAEIAACIERPIRYWNEAPPPIGLYYSTASFPYRYNWLNATISGLYSLAAAHYRRVHLPVQAGGVQVDDKNKSAEYQAIADKLWSEYKDWVKLRKVQLNCEAAVQTMGSPYSGWGYGY